MTQVWGQSTAPPTTNDLQLTGYVYGIQPSKAKLPLVGATMYVLPEKVGVLTNEEGGFELTVSRRNQMLITSFVGYQPDTIDLRSLSGDDASNLEVVLVASSTADSVQIEAAQAGTTVRLDNPLLIEGLNRKELLKAACCNLGESFETNASVDVNFPDAVSGTKQIQLLGLAGPYTQYTLESMPELRGLASGIGLDFIPGTWIDGIQIAKGSGSVVNGYESFSGQINVELQKPQTGSPLYLNAYGNRGGRLEFNAMTTQALGEGAGLTVLAHTSHRPQMNDRNQDGFLDMPLSEQYNGLMRLYISNQRSIEGQAGVQVVRDRRRGGQVRRWGEADPTAYGLTWETQHLRVWGKLGYINPNNVNESIGLQLSAIQHEQRRETDGLLPESLALYQGAQQSLYSNLIYQNILGNTDHQIRLGGSFWVDSYDEKLATTLSLSEPDQVARKEYVPGMFVEYTYKFLEKWRILAGLRGDWHNLWGFFVTPRLHVLYRPQEAWSVRFSGGRGQRTANVWSEVSTLAMASNRQVIFDPTGSQAYGFPPEVAWNLGLNTMYQTRLAYRPLQVRLEYFYTYFEQMTIMDREEPTANFDNRPTFEVYPSAGRADVHSLQLDVSYEPVRRMEVRLALKRQVAHIPYRIGTDIEEIRRLERPFLPAWRIFLNGSYQTRNGWGVDATLNWIGSQRLPKTAALPTAYQLDSRSPDYATMHVQVSKKWAKSWYVYVGGENILNAVQPNPISSAQDVRDPHFDATAVWGPIFGRFFYVGMNFQIDT